MELRHLKYFVAVAEELNFRKAAERLRISRPALSKQVQDLEYEISARLLNRNTTSVSLTKAGEIFLEDSRKILDGAERAAQRAREAQAGHRGELRIGSVGVIATDFLPKTLQLFHRQYPHVEVAFVEILPSEQMAALMSGDIDIGFAYGNEVQNVSSFCSLCVIQSTYGVALPRQHPLAQHQNLTIEQICAETLFCLGRSGHGEKVSEIYSDEASAPKKIRTIDGFDSLITLISAGQGISILPVVLDLTKQDVVTVPLRAIKADLDFHMWAVWKQINPSHHIQHFIKLLEERDLVHSSRLTAHTSVSIF